MISIGPYRPDQPVSAPGVSPSLSNVTAYQDVEVGIAYGPLAGVAALSTSTALPSEPKGSLTAVTKAGVYTLFVMTASTIYRVAATGVPTAIGTGYTLPAGDKWSATQFGTKAIFTNKNDGMLQYDIELGGAVTAISGAPKGRIVRRVFDVLFVLDCDGDNRLMRNSDFNYSNWSSGVANYQPMPEGTELVGIEEIADGIALVCTRNTVYVLNRRSDAQLYNMNVLARNTGAVAPWSIVPAGGAIYFIDGNGFKVADGSGVRRIGQGKVDRTILGTLTQSDLSAIEGAFDPQNERIRWRYQVVTPGNTYTSTAIDYYPRLDEFVPATINLSSVMTAASPGYTMEDLDAFGTMDAITLSLDDRYWYGGLPQLAAMDSTYSFAFFTGANLAATLKTSVQEMPQTGLVTWVKPVTDASPSIYLNVSDRLADNLTAKGPFTMQASGRVPTRARGKNIQMEAQIAAGTNWTTFRGYDGVVMQTGGPR
jgi:hypothetical protein